MNEYTQLAPTKKEMAIWCCVAYLSLLAWYLLSGTTAFDAVVEMQGTLFLHALLSP